MSTPQYTFGVGQLFFTPAGNSPLQVGALRGVKLDFDYQLKPLFDGQHQVAVTAAKYKGRLTGSCEFADLDGELLRTIFFGAPATPGSTRVMSDEPHLALGSPIAVDQAATFVQSLGVARADTQRSLSRVAAAPVGLQYTVDEATGTYGFDPLLAPWEALISYTYRTTAGATIPIVNRLLGASPIFSMVLKETYQRQELVLTLAAVKAKRLSTLCRQDDFTIQNLEFGFAANDAGLIGDISFAESQGFYWLVSRVYPLAWIDSFGPQATIAKGRYDTPVPESFNVSASIFGGTLGDILRSYDNGLAESFNVSASIASGVLTSVLRSYSDGLAETFNVSASFYGGTLDNVLRIYDSGLPESFNVSASIAGGTLT